MTKIFLAIIGTLLLLSETDTSFRVSQDLQKPPGATVTLYSANKYQGSRPPCLNLQEVTPGSRNRNCDVRYGALYVGDELDWFHSSADQSNRSVIKDLGLLDWGQAFTVPVVEPLRKLEPGEQRQITVDASGADGADGAPGRPGRDGADADGVVRHRTHDDALRAAAVPAVRSKPKHDGKLRVDPIFVKAVVGHMYVIHVVDDRRDLYALFRVEALERGDYCIISWRLIPAPDASANKAQMSNR